ncbi:ubiquinol-cytochrome C reductase [Hesseltinella vesiculosa]|uniref:Complex III subunit 9 n=1 Tax=Hesseltinella vesiculosa TaxID=101127 RepID=A0A1X2GYL3_9FUNG|nr:ubiquinol-cytochrome C reductase [Hesseltinella vesiculosa]
MPASHATGLTRTIYNTIFKRNSVFVTTVFAGALAFEVVYDSTTDKIWDNLNKGKQWKDIKHKYE